MSPIRQGNKLPAIEFRGLTVRNDKARVRNREYAVENLMLRVPRDKRTIMLGGQASGKSTIVSAIEAADKFPGMVSVNAVVLPLSLKDSRDWSTARYRQKYAPGIGPNHFIVVDEPYDQAFEFLLSLPNSMLVFACTDGLDLIDRFDLVVYLYQGRIVFTGVPKDFFCWALKANSDLHNDLLLTNIASSFKYKEEH